ncbi:MAG TPA: UDP-N-acetylglucosamine--N-acetylmuramyl-(pentapeptide) pyrophosphoryl-undecaprenol N-acetylglucosamine transferase, partial [Candidatus Paceibacterota bacterium]|nr:UDP-N-acetylglucosamine--N-acetylmuramyl-(pentapeptide) pyrophosphoryl-undecaprenol N-acetylglucosamine transferase [Candidatus Paceibacterota bacterium]
MEKEKKILLTAGGTGGHIVPLLAVADQLLKVGQGDLSLEFIGPDNNFVSEFKKRGIRVNKIASAKIRRYFSVKNLIDIPKFIWSIFQALVKMYFIMPDVVFSKGGPGSFPVVLAAKFYFIPVVIHESDAVPSLNSRLSSKFADRIAVSFRKTMNYFPKEKVFLSGKPLNDTFLDHWLTQEQAKEYFDFDPEEPLIFVMGGSQGAQRINDVVIDNLERVLGDFQVYHQVGESNVESVQGDVEPILKRLPVSLRKKYQFVSFLEEDDYKFAFNAADIVVSRAGSAIFDIAVFGKPSVLIPLEESANDHQKINAYEYAGNGGA